MTSGGAVGRSEECLKLRVLERLIDVEIGDRGWVVSGGCQMNDERAAEAGLRFLAP